MNPAQIFLIEDNPADVLLVKLALKESRIDHVLTEFTSGADAVRTLCAQEGSQRVVPDAILLDPNTPRSDGFDTLRKLRERFPEIPITIMSSSRARADKRRAAMEGVRYMEKGAELNEFLASLAAAVKDMLGETMPTAFPIG